jgi:long-chain acyl-CoA synthetase
VEKSGCFTYDGRVVMNGLKRYKVVGEVTAEGDTELVYEERPKNLAELLDNTTSKYGERIGLIDIDANIHLTYEQFSNSVNRMTATLYYKYGVRKGDRVALMLNNGIDYAISFFALARLGTIVVPINTAFKKDELAFQLNDSGSIMLIIAPGFEQILAEVRPQISQLKYVFVTGSKAFTGALLFSSLFEPIKYESFNTRISETDGAAIIYTSGTTGRPKGALLSHRGIIASAMNKVQICFWHTQEEKLLNVVPLFHVTGLVLTLVAPVLAGVPVVIAKKFKPQDALRYIQDEKITTMTAVPTIYWMMINEPEFGHYNISSLRIVLAGGSAVPDYLLKLWAEKLPGVPLLPGYGLTEACAMTHSMTTTEEILSHPGSVGCPLPLMQSKVVDSEGKELPFGEVGELLIKGCQVFKGYWKNSEATQETLVNGWLHSGDIAFMTASGYTYIRDRIKDMINRGGEKIFSLEVEEVLDRYPKILEAAVVAIPDPIFGEQVKAVVVLKPGEQSTLEEIQEFCGRHLAYFKVPKYIEFMAALPRNPAGKVLKGKLK